MNADHRNRPRKDWDELSNTRQEQIKREYARNFRCPECDGRLVFVLCDDKNEHTFVLHELWCTVPVRVRQLVNV